MPTDGGKIANIFLIAGKEFRNWVVKDLDPLSQVVLAIQKRHRKIVLAFSHDSVTTVRLKTYNVHLTSVPIGLEIKWAETDRGGRRTRDHIMMIRRGMLYLNPRSKADFGTVEIAKEQLHGGFGASELTQTQCGVIESEPSLFTYPRYRTFLYSAIHVIILCERDETLQRKRLEICVPFCELIVIEYILMNFLLK
ncbi:hypothetical protein TNCV_4504701 [Trichonephila clavipes]|nr:hypothetical protein TNCV_4504701 [Trichonephila clavipes]